METGYDAYFIAILVSIISFLGFVLENIWLVIRKGYIDNRNMSAPFLLGYGLLVVVIYMIMGTPQNMVLFGRFFIKRSKAVKYLLYFILSMLIVSAAEILLGLFVERFFGFEYWNYANIPLHITKYTSVPTSIGFALIIVFFMGKCLGTIMFVIDQICCFARRVLGIVLSAIMLVDFVVSFYKMYKNKSLNEKWRIYVNKDKEYKYI